ncbi:uncharacterized protein [Rutidosis leptorrhynchoides]|uniref:uncharacterized protein n=1 Tax=Rutidosis leptorrhynchoides TaxID=125765 RepID=UPI003A99D9C9
MRYIKIHKVNLQWYMIQHHSVIIAINYDVLLNFKTGLYCLYRIPEGGYSPSLYHADIIKQIVHPRFAKKITRKELQKKLQRLCCKSYEEHSKLAIWAFSDGCKSEAEFSFGSGQIDPTKATDPGLVYEISVEDYLQIWCNISRTAGAANATTFPLRLNFREINYTRNSDNIYQIFVFRVFPEERDQCGSTKVNLCCLC